MRDNKVLIFIVLPQPSEGDFCQRRQVRRLNCTSRQATASRAPELTASLIQRINKARSPSGVSRPRRFPRNNR